MGFLLCCLIFNHDLSGKFTERITDVIDQIFGDLLFVRFRSGLKFSGKCLQNVQSCEIDEHGLVGKVIQLGVLKCAESLGIDIILSRFRYTIKMTMRLI